MSEPLGPLEALDDYQQGITSEADALGFEEELFASAAAGGAPEAGFLDRVSLIQQHLEPRGGLDMGSTRQRVVQVLASGLKVQMIEPEFAPVMHLPAIEADAEIVVTHFRTDVRGFDSIDVEVSRPDGTLLKTFRDVNWDPEDGSLYALCEAPLARISTHNGRMVSRMIGYRDGVQFDLGSVETISPA